MCEFLESNVVAVEQRRMLAGRAIHVSSFDMLWVLFVVQLWTPLTQKGQSSAPSSCVWKKQIRCCQEKGYTVENYLEKENLEDWMQHTLSRVWPKHSSELPLL